MSNAGSRDNQTAMKDADRHATGKDSSVPLAESQKHAAHEHTKPVGDQREIELKEESNRKISRADQMRGGNRDR